MNLYRGHCVLTAIVLAVFTDTAVAEKFDRSTLTYRDSGLYCNLGFSMAATLKPTGLLICSPRSVHRVRTLRGHFMYCSSTVRLPWRTSN